MRKTTKKLGKSKALTSQRRFNLLGTRECSREILKVRCSCKKRKIWWMYKRTLCEVISNEILIGFTKLFIFNEFPNEHIIPLRSILASWYTFSCASKLQYHPKRTFLITCETNYASRFLRYCYLGSIGQRNPFLIPQKMVIAWGEFWRVRWMWITLTLSTYYDLFTYTWSGHHILYYVGGIYFHKQWSFFKYILKGFTYSVVKNIIISKFLHWYDYVVTTW